MSDSQEEHDKGECGGVMFCGFCHATFVTGSETERVWLRDAATRIRALESRNAELMQECALRGLDRGKWEARVKELEAALREIDRSVVTRELGQSDASFYATQCLDLRRQARQALASPGVARAEAGEGEDPNA